MGSGEVGWKLDPENLSVGANELVFLFPDKTFIFRGLIDLLGVAWLLSRRHPRPSSPRR
jgi:hypothetical protein